VLKHLHLHEPIIDAAHSKVDFIGVKPTPRIQSKLEHVGHHLRIRDNCTWSRQQNAPLRMESRLVSGE
jgi:hypothetical protein